MVPDTIACAASPGETRLALIAGGEIVELVVARPGVALGGVWLGRVAGGGRGQMFVDIGLERPGVLPGSAAEGQSLLVQATADPYAEKGARLTTAVSLAGRRVALSPSRPGVAVSRGIADAAEKARLVALGKALAAPGEGVVLRTAAAGAAAEVLAAELDSLRARWRLIGEAAAGARAPEMLLAPDPVGRMLADNPGVGRLLVDDDALYAALRPTHAGIIERRRGVFVETGADEALERALEPVVPLADGGRLVIEQAAAAVLVDVDSGAGAADAANDQAVLALARHLRLRNLSGHILFDVVPSRRQGRSDRLVAALRAAVADDPVPTHVVGTTPLGMIEMTRERRRASLAEVMLRTRLEPTPETVALAALRAVLAGSGHGAPRLSAAGDVAAALARLPAALAETERRLGRRLAVETDHDRRHGNYDISWD